MGSEPHRIYVDIDDVLAQTARGLVEVAAERFGSTKRYEDIHEFDLRASFGFDEPTYRRFMDAAHEPEVLLGFQVVDGAVAVLDAWRQARHTVCVVTGRPPTTEQATRRWLEEHGVAHATLSFVDKYGSHGPLYGLASIGLETLAQERYSFAVEDSLAMARFLAECGTPVALLTRPWNAGREVPGARRCADWMDVERCFRDAIG